jgi:hypothetical protein
MRLRKETSLVAGPVALPVPDCFFSIFVLFECAKFWYYEYEVLSIVTQLNKK